MLIGIQLNKQELSNVNTRSALIAVQNALTEEAFDHLTKENHTMKIFLSEAEFGKFIFLRYANGSGNGSLRGLNPVELDPRAVLYPKAA